MNYQKKQFSKIHGSMEFLVVLKDKKRRAIALLFNTFIQLKNDYCAHHNTVSRLSGPCAAMAAA